MRYRYLLGTTALTNIGTPPSRTGRLDQHRAQALPVGQHEARALREVRSKNQVSPVENSFSYEIEPQERGIIISNPMEINGNRLHIKSSEIDPFILRRALLFWDKIAWPKTDGIFIDGGPDIDFLESQEQLFRPKFCVSGDAATTLSMAFSETYRILSDRNPGQWLVSEGEDSLRVHGNLVKDGRGVIANFINAIPVPDRTIPLEDVIAFREKYLSEVIALRTQIDEFYQQWVNSEDRDHQLKLAITKIDSACMDLVKAARESKLPFIMSSWKVNFSVSLDAITAVAGLMGYFGADHVMELDTVGSLVSAAASIVLVDRSIGLRKSETTSPFNYVATLEKGLF